MSDGYVVTMHLRDGLGGYERAQRVDQAFRVLAAPPQVGTHVAGTDGDIQPESESQTDEQKENKK